MFASSSASSSELEFANGQHRSEDLLAEHRHVGRDAGEHRRPDEVAGRRARDRRLVARDHPRAIRLGLPNRRADVLILLRPGDRSHVGRLGSPSPTVIFSQRATSASRNGPAIGAVQQDAARGRAPLAGVREAGGDGGVDRLRQIGIVHHDQRVLAAELELRARQIRGGLAWIFLPTSVDPVNEIARTRGSSTMRIADRRPGPVTQLNTPAGKARTLEQRRP